MDYSFGLDRNVAAPPFSALLSVSMIAGVDALGLFALRSFPLGFKCDLIWIRLQSPLIGAALLLLVGFPLTLSGVFSRQIAVGFAVSLVCLGIARFIPLASAAVASIAAMRKYNFDPTSTALGLLVIAYALLALGPVTEADALDYHIGVALDILNAGEFPAHPEWFHSRLAGSGEVLIAIGLAIGAEQFGSLLQLSGVYAVLAVFVFPWQRDNSSARWLALAMLSTPIFVAWVASPKPMLLPGAMTTSALIMGHYILKQNSKMSEQRYRSNAFFFICLLTMTAATMKLNFMLSGGLVGGYAVFHLIRQSQWRLVLSIGSLMFFLLMAPFAYWKWQNFNGALGLLQAFPGNWPGTSNFETMLKNYRDTTVSFPISLLVPSGLGTVTTVLGVGLVFVLASVRMTVVEARGILVIASAVVVGVVLVGQKTSRFFLEPFYWLLIVYRIELLAGRDVKYLNNKLVRTAISAQLISVLGALLVGVILLLPGAVTPYWREGVMSRRANGYTAMKWADHILPKDATVVTYIRSIALAPRSSISNDWREHVAPGSTGERVYLEIIYSKHPNFLLISQEAGAPAPKIICASETYAGPFVSEVATRNPFNLGVKYSAWLLKVDQQCLKENMGD